MREKWLRPELLRQFQDCESFREVLAALERRARTQGLVVFEIVRNGEVLSETREEELFATSLVEMESLEVSYETPAGLLRQVISSQQGLCSDLSAAARAAGQAYRELRMSTAQVRLQDLLEGCQWFTDGLAAIKQAFGPSGADPDWFEAEKAYAEVLGQLIGAIEGGDAIFAADLLEHELPYALDQWESILRRLPESRPQGSDQMLS